MGAGAAVIDPADAVRRRRDQDPFFEKRGSATRGFYKHLVGLINRVKKTSKLLIR